MAERKYEKHIITEFKPGLELPAFRGKPGVPNERSNFMMWLGEAVIKGSPYVEAVWLWPGAADPKGGFPQHAHEHSEIIGFFSSDTGNVYNLGERSSSGSKMKNTCSPKAVSSSFPVA